MHHLWGVARRSKVSRPSHSAVWLGVLVCRVKCEAVNEILGGSGKQTRTDTPAEEFKKFVVDYAREGAVEGEARRVERWLSAGDPSYQEEMPGSPSLSYSLGPRAYLPQIFVNTWI